MIPELFVHKAREVLSFLHILKAKLSGDKAGEMKAIEDALKAMEDEKKVYLKEKREISSEPGQDISAI